MMSKSTETLNNTNMKHDYCDSLFLGNVLMLFMALKNCYFFFVPLCVVHCSLWILTKDLNFRALIIHFTVRIRYNFIILHVFRFFVLYCRKICTKIRSFISTRITLGFALCLNFTNDSVTHWEVTQKLLYDKRRKKNCTHGKTDEDE